MIISFDIDGVLAEANYVGEVAWNDGGKEKFGANLLNLKPRFPKLISYINRLRRHHVVQINSARCAEWWDDTRTWVDSIGISPAIKINCLGDDKLVFLKMLKPNLHFDDHPDYVQEEWGVRVWHPSWQDQPSEGMVSTAEEIIERISNEKKSNEDTALSGSRATQHCHLGGCRSNKA